MKRILLLIIFISGILPYIKADGCYSDYTRQYPEIKVKNNRAIIEVTVKDPDGICIAERYEIPIIGIETLEGFELVSDSGNFYLVKDNRNYYVVRKRPTYQERESEVRKALKIKPANVIKENKDTRFLKINDQWHYLDVSEYNDEITCISIPKQVSDFEIIHERERTLWFLIKTPKFMAVLNIINEYQNKKTELKIIPDLNLDETVFYKEDNYSDGSFLMDDDTYYLLTGGFTLKNRTSEFTRTGKKNRFNKLKLYRGWLGDMYFEDPDSDSTIWVYYEHGVTVNDSFNVDEASMYLFPIKAVFVNKHGIGILKREGKFYRKGWEAIYKVEDVEISKVADIEHLESVAGGEYYKDNYQNYKYDYDSNSFIPYIPEQPEMPKGKYYKEMKSYGAYTPPFYADGSFLYFYNPDKTLERKIACQSPVKNLTKAYAYDDKLLIENREIVNIADRESMEFIGAIVDAVIPCNIGPLDIRYHYYFKDKDGIYTYYSGNDFLEKNIGEVPELLN